MASIKSLRCVGFKIAETRVWCVKYCISDFATNRSVTCNGKFYLLDPIFFVTVIHVHAIRDIMHIFTWLVYHVYARLLIQLATSLSLAGTTCTNFQVFIEHICVGFIINVALVNDVKRNGKNSLAYGWQYMYMYNTCTASTTCPLIQCIHLHVHVVTPFNQSLTYVHVWCMYGR